MRFQWELQLRVVHRRSVYQAEGSVGVDRVASTKPEVHTVATQAVIGGIVMVRVAEGAEGFQYLAQTGYAAAEPPLRMVSMAMGIRAVVLKQ